MLAAEVAVTITLVVLLVAVAPAESVSLIVKLVAADVPAVGVKAQPSIAAITEAPDPVSV